MKCCFIQETDRHNQQIILKGPNFHHIIRVLRLKIGESLEFKDHSYAYRAILTSKQKEIASFQIQSKRKLKKPKLEIHLCQSLLEDKNSFEWLLQKSTELGVTSIIPYVAERSQRGWHTIYSSYSSNYSSKQSKKLSKEQSKQLSNEQEPEKERWKKQKRWEKIIQRASQQSGRDFLTQLYAPISNLESLLAFSSFSKPSSIQSPSIQSSSMQSPSIQPSSHSSSHSTSHFLGPVKIIALESIEKPSFRTLLSLHSEAVSFFLLVGPEGGFSDRECKQAQELSFLPCSLSPLTWKSETASLSMLANLQFFYL